MTDELNPVPGVANTALPLDLSQVKLEADPYLQWANATAFRDFSLKKESLKSANYQVVVLCNDSGFKNPKPIPDSPGWPQLGLREICRDGKSNDFILTGLVLQDQLQELINQNVLLELNVPRYDNDFQSSGGGLRKPSEPKLGKRVMAIIDFGCPFGHKQFWDGWNETTRVRYFWDQDATRTIRVPEDEGSKKNAYWFANDLFQYGRETTSEELKSLFRRCSDNGVVDEDLLYELANYSEMQEPTSHGAHVMDLASGRINPMSGLEDDASGADIIFVQLPKNSVKDTSGGSMTMYVLDALKYILEKTKDVEQLVINMSFGSTAGPHDGTSLLERGMDMLIEQERTARKGEIKLVLPAGNHFLADLHGAVTLNSNMKEATFLWEIMPDDYTENYMELWCEAGTELKVTLIPPQSKECTLEHTKNSEFLDGNKAALVRATGSACGKGEMVLVALAPTGANKAVRVESGVWSITVAVENPSGDVVVNAWVERDDPIPWQSGQPQCRLLASTVDRAIDSDDAATDTVKRENTGNSLASGKVPIVVGGYVVNSFQTTNDADVVLSAFSASENAVKKFNYLAPSDETDALNGILAASNRSDTLARMNGTSVAAPQVARQLLNDPDKRRIAYPSKPSRVGDMRDKRGIGVPRAY